MIVEHFGWMLLYNGEYKQIAELDEGCLADQIQVMDRVGKKHP